MFINSLPTCYIIDNLKDLFEFLVPINPAPSKVKVTPNK